MAVFYFTDIFRMFVLCFQNIKKQGFKIFLKSLYGLLKQFI